MISISRSRAALAGGMSPGSWRRRGSRRTWPGRPIPRRCAGGSGTPGPTRPTPGTLRAHLLAGDLPECWIPPEQVLEARAVARLYKDLVDERGAWHQRIAATMFRQGVPVTGSMSTPAGRAAAANISLSPAGRQAVEAGLRQIDRLTGELDPLRRQLDLLSRRQPGCRALRATQYGVGAVTSVAIWAGLGDVRRFASSDDVIRHTGLDITVCSSDGKRPAGHLARQGPPLLRWALYEAAKCAAKPASPDHGYCTAARDRRNAGLATLSVARKLARRCYHTLRKASRPAVSEHGGVPGAGEDAGHDKQVACRCHVVAAILVAVICGVPSEASHICATYCELMRRALFRLFPLNQIHLVAQAV